MNYKRDFAVVSLFLVILIDSLGWGIIYPILDPIILQNVTGLFGTSATLAVRNFWYEAMVGIYCLCMFLSSPLLGSLSDRYGRKIILASSLLGGFVGFLVSGLGLLSNSLVIIILGRIIAGSTAGCLPIAQAAMMDISTSEEKPKRLSFVALANVSGFAIGPFVGGALIDKDLWGPNIAYAYPFWAGALIALIGLIMLLILFKDFYTGNKDQEIRPWTGFLNLYSAVKMKSIRSLCLIFTAFLLAWVLFFSVAPLLLAERFSWSVASVGSFIGVLAMCLGLGVVLVMPWLSKKISIKKIVVGSLIAMLICTGLFPFIHISAFLWILAPLCMAIPFIYIGLATLFSESVDTSMQGLIMGILGSLVAFCWGIGPVIVGFLTRYNLNITYLVSFCLFLSAILTFVAYLRKLKNKG